MAVKPHRYLDIPRCFTGCVYAAELSNGLVKVGFSRNPRTRMASLAGEVRRSFGARICRYYISRNLAVRTAADAEARVLERLRRLAAPLKGKQEYFDNLSFGAATTLIQQVVTAATMQQEN